MIAFIKSYNLAAIKKKFLLLYFLNVSDIIFTLLLIRTGYFTEVNILMVKAVESPLASFVIKILFPALLLYYIYISIRDDADHTQLKASNIAINISLTIYSLVNLSHVIWVILLPIFIAFS